jgi:hypothetical protein
MLNKRLKKKLSVIYAILLAALGLFIYFSLQRDYVEVEEKESDKVGREERMVDVVLNVEDGGTYDLKMKNTDTILDLLEEVRDNTDFSFEKVAYTYGTEIDQVNKEHPPEGTKWAVFKDNENVTSEIGDIYLENDKNYELLTIRSEELQ